MRIDVDCAKDLVGHQRIEKRPGSTRIGRLLWVRRDAQVKMVHTPFGEETIRVEQ